MTTRQPNGMGHKLSGFTVGIFLLVLLVTGGAIAACQADILEPPRAATSTAQAALAPTTTPTAFVSVAPTATPGGVADQVNPSVKEQEASSSVLRFWVSQADDRGRQVLEDRIAGFAAETGIQVEPLFVSPKLLPELMQSAVISGTLPDLVLHPVEYSHGWTSQGILDETAATAVLEKLDPSTFEPGALAQLAGSSAADSVVALPSEGWQQLLLYRTDWFEELGLAPPDSYEKLALAAEAIFEEDSPVAGLIVPTDSSLVSTQQVFEHIAISNGCRLTNRAGEIALLHPACLSALEYYRALINDYSPVGLQTDISALNGYLSGRTAIIMASPSVLPIIGGLSDAARPSCPECSSVDYLANNTGIITTLVGEAEGAQPANFSSITALGITTAANSQDAMAFAEYWFNELYPHWLSVNPEQKVPMRLGAHGDNSRFVDLWRNAPLAPGGPTLIQSFGEQTAELLSKNVADSDRWGFAYGQGDLVTTIYEELLFAPLLQDMLSGYFTSSQTIVEMYLTAVDAVPGYDFPIQVAPTPTP